MRLILDDLAKERVITIMAFGGTRQSAATVLNCHPRTIYNAEKRDPKFAQDLRSAYSDMERSLIHTMVNSAVKGRASSASWLLERLNPDKFGKRKPGCYTYEMVQQMLSGLAETFVKLAPSDSHRDFALSVLTEVSKEQLLKNEPFLKDCVPLYREHPDYVEEARKYREGEYAKIDAEEEIAYREYEAKKAAEERKAQVEREKEQAAKEQQAKAKCETASVGATIVEDVKAEVQPQAAAVTKQPKLSKSARRKLYRAGKRAVAVAQPSEPLVSDSLPAAESEISSSADTR